MKLKILSLALVAFCSIELSPQKMGDAYALNINNIYPPLNRDGVLADVDAPPIGPGGQFGGHTFLFSGGFFLSGYSKWGIFGGKNFFFFPSFFFFFYINKKIKKRKI